MGEALGMAGEVNFQVSFGCESVSTDVAFVRPLPGVRSKQKHPVTRAHA